MRSGKLTKTFLILACFLLTLLLFLRPHPRFPPFDLVITNGHIVDGTGSPWYSGDVGIRDGKIAAIGNLSARRARAPSMHGQGRRSRIHRHAGPVGD